MPMGRERRESFKSTETVRLIAGTRHTLDSLQAHACLDKHAEQKDRIIPQRGLQTKGETPTKQGDTMRTIVVDVCRRPAFSESPLWFGVSSGEFSSTHKQQVRGWTLRVREM